MARMIVCAAVLVALVGAFCAAQDYAPAPTPKPAPKSPGEPVFTDAQLRGGAGLPSNGLQLTLIADNLVLPEKPGSLGQPLIIQPTALHLLFRNVSDRPIVLDTYNLALSRLAMIVVGPEKKTVVVTRKPLSFRSREALPIDYTQIEPGNPFVPMPLQFPGDFNLLFNYGLYVPGVYKVQVIYSRPASAGPAAWEGMVVSNTLAFRIEGPMPPTPPETTPPDKPPEVAPQPTPQAPPPPTGPPS
jgi:hypothetical protein